MEIIKNIREKNPLVHCITNTVTINDCANALLAIGARPVMAEHPDEAAEITAAADALLINTGTIYPSKIEAMKRSAKAAKEKGIPFVLDCVGAMSSSVRKLLISELIKINIPTIIKGNAAEIEAVTGGDAHASGVDSTEETDYKGAITAAKKLGTVIMVTGERDFITDGEYSAIISNGTPMLSKVTGTGCMLGCITAAAAAANEPFKAAKHIAAVMGICGERADTGCGTGTFRVHLIDELSLITDEIISNNIKEV